MRFDFKIKNNQLFLVVGIVGYFYYGQNQPFVISFQI